MSKIRLIENGVKIDGQVFKIGDLVKAVDKGGRVQFEGRVEFGIYADGEGYADYYHLGFFVEDPLYPLCRYTLIDLVDKGWEIKIDSQGGKNEEGEKD
ncbi:MAG: hypothetical protein ACXQTS_02195 [Candidatus Methanospirareceae archaeon]